MQQTNTHLFPALPFFRELKGAGHGHAKQEDCKLHCRQRGGYKLRTELRAVLKTASQGCINTQRSYDRLHIKRRAPCDCRGIPRTHSTSSDSTKTHSGGKNEPQTTPTWTSSVCARLVHKLVSRKDAMSRVSGKSKASRHAQQGSKTEQLADRLKEWATECAYNHSDGLPSTEELKT